jgi:hypothetical protein
MATIRFKAFSIVVPDGEEEKFMKELEALCRKYAPGEAYYFRFDVEG